MNDKWRGVGCILLSLMFLMCVFSLLLMVGASGAPSDNQLIRSVDGYSEQSAQGQQLPNDSRIQILDRRFNDIEIRQGQEIYTAYCGVCHGIDGQGQFPEAPLLPDSTGRIGAPPHDDTGHSWHHSDEILIRYVQEGGFSDLTRFYPMPPFQDILTDEQTLLVIAYIKTMWTGEQRVMQRELTEEERRLFSD
ncbi:MAG: cytochrome c [bacterium]|nr:cytochrome c [bacterium]